MAETTAEVPEPPITTADTPARRAHPQPPRPGDLTLGWRATVAATWIGVAVAFAAVWGASVQLGLSTWWLGPRGDPQPRVVQFLPFVLPVALTLATINRVRRLPMLGVGGAVLTAGFGIGDLGRVSTLAVLELVIAAAAGAVSIAALSGQLRPATTG